jgi:hypothetical protein
MNARRDSLFRAVSGTDNQKKTAEAEMAVPVLVINILFLTKSPRYDG